jgi:aspartyl/glutamyl-tRNA(Asn/Gln) amidotransferase C subunit
MLLSHVVVTPHLTGPLDVTHVLHRFGRLRDVDVTGVEPSPRGAELGATPEELLARLRPDDPVTFAHKEELFKAASSFESPYFRVPKIMEKDQAD